VLSREDYILVELLGRDSPQIQALVAAAANPDLAHAVHEMLRSLARQGRGPTAPSPQAGHDVLILRRLHLLDPGTLWWFQHGVAFGERPPRRRGETKDLA